MRQVALSPCAVQTGESPLRRGVAAMLNVPRKFIKVALSGKRPPVFPLLPFVQYVCCLRIPPAWQSYGRYIVFILLCSISLFSVASKCIALMFRPAHTRAIYSQLQGTLKLNSPTVLLIDNRADVNALRALQSRGYGSEFVVVETTFADQIDAKWVSVPEGGSTPTLGASLSSTFSNFRELTTSQFVAGRVRGSSSPTYILQGVNPEEGYRLFFTALNAGATDSQGRLLDSLSADRVAILARFASQYLHGPSVTVNELQSVVEVPSAPTEAAVVASAVNLQTISERDLAERMLRLRAPLYPDAALHRLCTVYLKKVPLHHRMTETDLEAFERCRQQYIAARSHSWETVETDALRDLLAAVDFRQLDERRVAQFEDELRHSYRGCRRAIGQRPVVPPTPDVAHFAFDDAQIGAVSPYGDLASPPPWQGATAGDTKLFAESQLPYTRFEPPQVVLMLLVSRAIQWPSIWDAWVADAESFARQLYRRRIGPYQGFSAETPFVPLLQIRMHYAPSGARRIFGLKGTRFPETLFHPAELSLEYLQSEARRNGIPERLVANIVPSSKQCIWGDLNPCEYRLVSDALKTYPAAMSMIFISETTVPAKPFSHVYASLTENPRSRFFFSNINLPHVRKHHQWIVLARRHAALLARYPHIWVCNGWLGHSYARGGIARWIWGAPDEHSPYLALSQLIGEVSLDFELNDGRAARAFSAPLNATADEHAGVRTASMVGSSLTGYHVLRGVANGGEGTVPSRWVYSRDTGVVHGDSRFRHTWVCWWESPEALTDERCSDVGFLQVRFASPVAYRRVFAEPFLTRLILNPDVWFSRKFAADCGVLVERAPMHDTDRLHNDGFLPLILSGGMLPAFANDAYFRRYASANLMRFDVWLSRAVNDANFAHLRKYSTADHWPSVLTAWRDSILAHDAQVIAHERKDLSTNSFTRHR